MRVRNLTGKLNLLFGYVKKEDEKLESSLRKYGFEKTNVDFWLAKDENEITNLQRVSIERLNEWFGGEFRPHRLYLTADILQYGMEEIEKKIDSRRGIQGSDRAKVEALSGLYQIVRPHIYNPACFIAEILEVSVGSDGSAELFMFSHNFPSIEYRYSGELKISTRYASALIERQHEVDSGRMAMRTLSMMLDVSLQRLSVASVLSGLLVRGVAAKSIRRMVVGAPFVAIRPSEPIEGREGQEYRFEPLGAPPLNSCHQLLGAYVSGEISREKKPELYRLCDLALSAIEPVNDRHDLIRTFSPDEIQKNLMRAFGSAAAPFDVWRAAVQKEIEKHGEQVEAAI